MGLQGRGCSLFAAQVPLPAVSPPKGDTPCILDCNMVGNCLATKGLCQCPAGEGAWAVVVLSMGGKGGFSGTDRRGRLVSHAPHASVLPACVVRAAGMGSRPRLPRSMHALPGPFGVGNGEWRGAIAIDACRVSTCTPWPPTYLRERTHAARFPFSARLDRRRLLPAQEAALHRLQQGLGF